ncbi:MAG: hypothetical protein ACRD6W_13570, partial [Nitrososphaerales archaeon]
MDDQDGNGASIDSRKRYRISDEREDDEEREDAEDRLQNGQERALQWSEKDLGMLFKTRLRAKFSQGLL